MGPIFEGEEKGTFELSSFRMHERGCSKRAGKKVDERDVNFFFRESEKGPKFKIDETSSAGLLLRPFSRSR